MGAAWHPGQVLLVGFSGTRIPRDLAEDVAAGRVGGVIFFSRNVESPEQLRSVIRHLRELQPDGAPLLVAVDQEGGRVARLRDPWATWPPARSLGEHGDPGLAREFGSALGTQLRREGFNLDFAPVVDVDSNPQNPVIGDRSLSARSQVVGELGAAVVEGLQASSVAACAKHFPGHGDTDLDSHLDLPSLSHERTRLEEVELPPFRAAIKAGVASIMTAHVVFSAIDPTRPATLSPDAIALLRHELAYDGVVFTDDLEMGAVAKHHSVEQRILGPLRAGVDGLLVCSKADMRAEAIRLLEGAADALVERAIERIRDLKARFPGQVPEDGELPDPEHVALSSRIRGG